MNKVKLNYNEKSWAIDVISHINLFCSKNNLFVRKAGGERTIKDGSGNSLFPDVLIMSKVLL